MAVNRRYDILAIVVLVLGILAYASIRAELRLREDMPAEFVERSNIPKQRQPAEEKIARAYWKCAVEEVQWKYGYARRLPEEPPPEFSLREQEFGAAANDAAMRNRYWQRLRQLWGVSSLWKTQYEFTLWSVRGSMQSGGDWLERLMHRITGY